MDKVSLENVVIFDLYKDKMSIDEFKERAKFPKEYQYGLIKLKIGDIYYDCLYDSAYIHILETDTIESVSVSKNLSESGTIKSVSMSENFLSDHVFLKTSLKDPSSGSIRTKKINGSIEIVCLHGRNKLETIIHLRVMFCKMVGITSIRIHDSAISEKYRLLYYRIFVTNKDVSELSIYSKFFKIKLCSEFNDFLNEIRTEKFNTLIEKYNICKYMGQSEQKKLSNLNISDSLSTYFSNKSNLDHLDDICELLYEHFDKFKDLIDCIRDFTVKVDDYLPSILLLHKNKFKSIPKKSSKSLKKSKTKSKPNPKKSKTKPKSKRKA